MINKNAFLEIREELRKKNVSLVAVSKQQPDEKVSELYRLDQRIFGENRATELKERYTRFPGDIEWHMIGHLQTNKVKYIIPCVSLIHSVDSFRLLRMINQEAFKCDRKVDCLLQVYIAREETKFGFDEAEIRAMLTSSDLLLLRNIHIRGLMGMATQTDDMKQVAKEFRGLSKLFRELKSKFIPEPEAFNILSMGMSDDFKIAVEEGSNMVRIGTLIFGDRNANN